MISNYSKLILCLICITFISACTHIDGHYAVLSDRRIPLSALTFTNTNKAITQTSITSRRHVVVFIPFSKAPTLGDAVEEILRTYKGDYLADVTVEQIHGQAMFWYQYKAWKISGTVMKIHD